MTYRLCLLFISIILSTLITPEAFARNYFGAIAVASNGAYGYSYDHSSRRNAENGTLRECRKRGRGCRNALWFRNACGALVMNNRNAWATAWGSTRNRAERQALRTCNRKYGGCYVKRWVCTSGR